MKSPKVDGTDFYIFNRCEAGREDFGTIAATYQPIQDGGAGPNYYTMDEIARYDIHIDNNRDAKKDLTFRFHFQTSNKYLALNIDPEGNVKPIAVPATTWGRLPPATPALWA